MTSQLRANVQVIKMALDRAFDSLMKQGIYAVANSSCCQGCSLKEMRENHREGDRGYCFYHWQDIEMLEEKGEVYISFGSFDESEFDESDTDFNAIRGVAIGKEIEKAIKEEGLKTKWPGNIDTRILVTSGIVALS